MNPSATMVLAALALAACAGPQVVVEYLDRECKVPEVVTDPVPVPAPLALGATNGDLWLRGGPQGSLETALEKCNARLQDVQSTLKGSTTTQPTQKSGATRLRDLVFGKPKEAP